MQVGVPTGCIGHYIIGLISGLAQISLLKSNYFLFGDVIVPLGFQSMRWGMRPNASTIRESNVHGTLFSPSLSDLFLVRYGSGK